MDFQKLTPIGDAKIDGYTEALDYVFNNDDILNVAVSGPYSAGKSSIIKTYKQQKNKEIDDNQKSWKNRFKKIKEKVFKKDDNGIKFLHISLACFENEDKEKVTDKMLEGKILNQLIQQINPRKIPQSNFRTKRSHPLYQKGLFAFGIVMFILIIFYLIYFTPWTSYVRGLPDGWAKSVIAFLSANQVNRLLWLIVAVVMAFWGLYTIINIQLNKGLLKKLSVQGNEIEIFSDEDDSYFDKYLNEVLYLFEKSDADVVVFEDIDRYDSIEIFQRLREINSLVNRKQNRSIRFFYLLRDDMFVTKDRTKFFDFMIPVVPVVDSTNSYDLLLNMFQKESKLDFNQDFLQGVSLYIDDMRILKNICNEFIVYRNLIGTTEQDNNKLLAVVIYKNIFPRDFSELQLNRGFVYSVFSRKAVYIADEEERIEAAIQEYTGKLEVIDKEVLKDKEEIELVYQNGKYHRYGVSSGELLPEHREERRIRLEKINNKTDEKIADYQNEIEKLRKEKSALYDKKLSEIITRDNIDQIFTIEYLGTDKKYHYKFTDFVKNNYFDLLKYLIRNGLIDETYPDYMSYFYEHSISATDKKFLRSIVDQKAKDYQYKLTNPQHIVDRLKKVDFYSEEILNYDLLEYLLHTYDVDHPYIENFVKRLRENCALDFVFGFLDRSNESKPFIKALCSFWSGIFDEAVKAQDHSEEQKCRLALQIVYFADESLPSVNSCNSLTDYIDHNAEFLDITHPMIETIIQAFETLDIQFEDIDFDTANVTLLQSVYKNDMYALNEVMTGKILEKIYGIERSDRFLHQNLTLIRSLGDSPLYQYVDNYINTYIEQYTSFCQGTVSDDEETIAWVLNHEALDDVNKELYFDYLSVGLNHLNLIDELDWKVRVLSKNLAVCSMENIMDYFFTNENEYDEVLVGFINQNETPNDIASALKNYEKEQISTFFGATVKCNDLNNRKYSALIKGIDLRYNSFRIIGIEGVKILILIDLDVIRMNNEDILMFMRENYPNQTIRFIEKNIKPYCDSILNKDIFDLDEAVALLSSRARLNYKLKILNYTSEPISACNKGYPDKLVFHLLKNNFDEDDLPILLTDYGRFSADCQSVIQELLASNIYMIIRKEYAVSYQLLKDVMNKHLVTDELQLGLLSLSIEKYDENQAKECLNRLEQYQYLSLFEGKHPKFPITTTNKRILDAFLKRHWISSYSTEDGEYRAYGRKTENKEIIGSIEE